MIQNGHTHEVDLETSFDFINTLEYDDGSPVEHLGTPEAAIGWLVERQLIHPEPAASARARSAADPVAGEELLDQVRGLRWALREVTDSIVEERAADRHALERVNEALRHREVLQLVPAESGIAVDHRHEGDPFDDALARLAGPIAEEIAGGRPERLRICANDECRWAFYDSSPAGRRRWCDMSSCGNRAKAARHRARVKAAQAAVESDLTGEDAAPFEARAAG